MHANKNFRAIIKNLHKLEIYVSEYEKLGTCINIHKYVIFNLILLFVIFKLVL